MILSFLVTWLMEYRLYETRVLLQSDVWFQADPDVFASTLIEPGAFALRHPNVGFFVGLPIVWVEALLSRIGFSGPGLHDWIVLAIAPIAAGLRSLAAFQALFGLTRRIGLATLLVLLDISAFQSVALGSVPEHFPLTALCIAAMYWRMMVDVRSNAPVRYIYWITIGTVAVGVTASNLMPFVVLLLTTLLLREISRWRAVVMSVLLAICALALNTGIAWARTPAFKSALLGQVDISGTDYGVRWPAMSNAPEIAWAIAHTFLAPQPDRVPGSEGLTTNPDYAFQILYPHDYPHGFDSWWRGLATLGLVAVGLCGWAYGHRSLMSVAAITITLGHALLFLMYGHHFFLYGLHWSFSLTWLLAGLCYLPNRRRRVATGLLGVFVVLTATNSVIRANELLHWLWTA